MNQKVRRRGSGISIEIIKPMALTKVQPPEGPNPPLMKGTTIKVHNHGFVRYIDHLGSDLDILEAARISYKSPSKGEVQDKKLLRYLFTHKHTSPFEMVKIKFNIKMPIFVMRQYVRHRMQNLNEVSARYTELPNEFFVPEKWRYQDKVNKQGSLDMGPTWDPVVDVMSQETASQVTRRFHAEAYRVYESLLKVGIAREQARMVLPVSIYTEIYCCWDLNNLIKFFTLRDDPHAQGEHQDYAKAMKQLTAECFPWTMEIYEETQAVK